MGNIKSSEMLKTFNCGIGMCVIVDPSKADQIVKNFNTQGEEASIIGKLEKNLKNKNIIIEDKNKIWHN